MAGSCRDDVDIGIRHRADRLIMSDLRYPTAGVVQGWPPSGRGWVSTLSARAGVAAASKRREPAAQHPPWLGGQWWATGRRARATAGLLRVFRGLLRLRRRLVCLRRSATEGYRHVVVAAATTAATGVVVIVVLIFVLVALLLQDAGEFWWA